MLGRALMALCRRKYPNIESMEILFVTAGSTELRPLEVIAQKSRALWYRATEEEPGRDKALDSCHGIGCAVCDSKMICDGIRTFLQRENE